MSVVRAESEATSLSERDHAILDFESAWFTASMSKDDEIRERFEMSSTRYHQILNALLDNPAALASHPLLVKRLRRQRDLRRDQRSAARLVQHGR